MSIDLPENILTKADFQPFEKVVLHILRTKIPELPVFSLVPLETADLDFFAITRRDMAFGTWGGKDSLLDEGKVWVHVFTQDPDGDTKGALVSEAIRVAMHEAYLENMQIPDLGCWINRIVLADEPSRKTDWATAAGPVQFADLPQRYWRYESKYDLRIRYGGK